MRPFLRDLRGLFVLALFATVLGVIRITAVPAPLHLSDLLSGRVLIADSPTQRLSVFTFSDVPEISKPELLELIQRADGLVIDARSPMIFDLGHLPNAHNLPRSTFERSYRSLSDAGLLRSQTPIVVYCESQACPDAGAVARLLIANGHSDVRVFSGGWEEWEGVEQDSEDHDESLNQ